MTAASGFVAPWAAIVIGFVAGVHRRAPDWMQRSGLEWAHRLAREPRRLMRRYLVDDAPFAVQAISPLTAVTPTNPATVTQRG